MDAAGFSGSYRPQDVTFLLKPISIEPTDVDRKERLIQSGERHYSEMISAEDAPQEDYLALYRSALARNGARLAQDIVNVAGALDTRSAGRGEIVLASLARAGTPIGILLARALRRMGRSVAHYSISIIRDRGIDARALAYIAARHEPRDTVFVDGWTGKGAIARELRTALAASQFSPVLAVVADPAGQADIAATGDDYLIASGLLNSVVSGLVSRSILGAAPAGPDDFHACVHYRHLAAHDLSRAFIGQIERLAVRARPRPLAADGAARATRAADCATLVATLLEITRTRDPNRIKPGIAEATRALLRRVPDALFVRERNDPDVAHLLLLAAKRAVSVRPLPGAGRYRAVAVVKSLGLTAD